MHRLHSIPRGPDNVQNDRTFSACPGCRAPMAFQKHVVSHCAPPHRCRLLAWWWSPPLISSGTPLLVSYHLASFSLAFFATSVSCIIAIYSTPPPYLLFTCFCSDTPLSRYI